MSLPQPCLFNRQPKMSRPYKKQPGHSDSERDRETGKTERERKKKLLQWNCSQLHTQGRLLCSSSIKVTSVIFAELANSDILKWRIKDHIWMGFTLLYSVYGLFDGLFNPTDTGLHNVNFHHCSSVALLLFFALVFELLSVLCCCGTEPSMHPSIHPCPSIKIFHPVARVCVNTTTT